MTTAPLLLQLRATMTPALPWRLRRPCARLWMPTVSCAWPDTRRSAGEQLRSVVRHHSYQSSSLLFSVYSIQFLFHTRGAPVMRYRQICAVDRSCYSVVQHKISKSKLAWFSRLIRHSARKRGGLILYNAPERTRDDRWFAPLSTYYAAH